MITPEDAARTKKIHELLNQMMEIEKSEGNSYRFASRETIQFITKHRRVDGFRAAAINYFRAKIAALSI